MKARPFLIPRLCPSSSKCFSSVTTFSVSSAIFFLKLERTILEKLPTCFLVFSRATSSHTSSQLFCTKKAPCANAFALQRYPSFLVSTNCSSSTRRSNAKTRAADTKADTHWLFLYYLSNSSVIFDASSFPFIFPFTSYRVNKSPWLNPAAFHFAQRSPVCHKQPHFREFR